jgi:hypothetical protein
MFDTEYSSPTGGKPAELPKSSVEKHDIKKLTIVGKIVEVSGSTPAIGINFPSTVSRPEPKSRPSTSTPQKPASSS